MDVMDIEVGKTYQYKKGIVKITAIIDPGFDAVDKNDKTIRVYAEELEPIIKRQRLFS